MLIKEEDFDFVNLTIKTPNKSLERSPSSRALLTVSSHSKVQRMKQKSDRDLSCTLASTRNSDLEHVMHDSAKVRTITPNRASNKSWTPTPHLARRFVGKSPTPSRSVLLTPGKKRIPALPTLYRSAAHRQERNEAEVRFLI